MTPFVRFIFTLVIIGVSLNLGIVLLANSRSQKAQIRDLASEKEKFAAVMARFNARQRRGDIAVEWQKTDANLKVVQTSLLVRVYSLDDTGQRIPLPIIRVVIPGNRLSIDGLLFSFQSNFSDTYASVRDVKLAYFNHIYAESQPPDERFALLTPYEPPLSTRLNFDHVTHFEIQFWQYVWDLMNTAGHDPAKTLIVTQATPVDHIVSPGIVYSIFITNFDTTPIITESNDSGLLAELLNEAAHQDDEAAHPNDANLPSHPAPAP